eukprot:8474019-Heterocapsa_arctica.AAC.1
MAGVTAGTRGGEGRPLRAAAGIGRERAEARRHRLRTPRGTRKRRRRERAAQGRRASHGNRRKSQRPDGEGDM